MVDRLKNPTTFRRVLSLAVFYVAWWGCAIAAQKDQAWLGILAIAIAALIHLYKNKAFKTELAMLFFCGLLGFLLDSAFLRLGLFQLSNGQLWAPLWLVCMWALFATSLESMLILRRNTWVLMALGATGGPISYYAGEALGLLQYARPLGMTLAIHGAVWAVLVLALFRARDFALKAFREHDQGYHA